MRPKPDPRAVFATAEEFWAATDGLLRLAMQEQGIRAGNPGMALSAMTLELYLKCLALLEGKEARENTHHLWKLFTYLNGTTQNRIRQIAAPRIKERNLTLKEKDGSLVVLADFDKILKLSANALTTSRYPYEGIPPGIGWAAGAILVATREVILEMRPDFHGARLHYPAGLSAPIVGPV
jgi:hypothetical protein